MATPYPTLAPQQQLLFPALGGVYAMLAKLSVLVMRVTAGLLLVIHGWPKIQDPFKNAGMVESLGFVPGTLWSALLAGTEFFGGLLLAIGFLTRPAGVGTTIVLLVTVYFHWIVQAQGLAGSEKSLLWAAITLYFVAHGGGFLSVDRALRREI